MIKSNSKIFREKVKKYVIECMEDGENDIRECLQIASEDFNAWYCDYNKKQYPNITNALVQYFYCGSTDIAIYYDDQRALLKEWFEQTESEAQKYDDVQVCDNFYYQVSKSFISLCKDYNINIKEDLQEKTDKKYNLYYQNYETKTGTQKDFGKATEVLNLDDVKPISGTQQDIEKFIPKLVKTSGRNGIYYIHQCLIVVDSEDCFIEDFIYKTIDNEIDI